MAERDPDLINPGWVRPADWKYAEDWDSPAWRRRMAESERIGAERRRKYGFITCPACKMGHTNFTLSCRECGHKCIIPKEESSHASEVKPGVEPEQRPG